MKKYVFISYSSHDKTVADAACAALEAGGIGCWIAPRDVLPGKEYGGAIVEGIKQSALFVLILSSRSNQSPQVLREVERAVSNGKPIIPFRVEDIELSSSMEYYVSSQHWLDAASPHMEAHLETLAVTAAALLKGSGRDAGVEAGMDPAPLHKAPPPRPAPPGEEPSAPGRQSEATGPALDPDGLSEKEFGGGAELSTTGFLIFGLLTFWIYTVWVYHRILSDHLASRLDYLTGLFAEDEIGSAGREALPDIRSKGFFISDRVKYLCSVLYLLCIVLLTAQFAAQFLYMAVMLKESIFDTVTIAAYLIAALSFCAASVYFLTWVGLVLKRHEYYESLMVSLVSDPENFKVIRPSSGFVDRWNRNQNWIALFLVLAVPMIVSPAVGVFHFYQVLRSGGDHELVLIVWGAVIFAFAAVFHLGGTRILLNMYHAHLRIEAQARSQLLRVKSRF